MVSENCALTANYITCWNGREVRKREEEKSESTNKSMDQEVHRRIRNTLPVKRESRQFTRGNTIRNLLEFGFILFPVFSVSGTFTYSSKNECILLQVSLNLVGSRSARCSSEGSTESELKKKEIKR